MITPNESMHITATTRMRRPMLPSLIDLLDSLYHGYSLRTSTNVPNTRFLESRSVGGMGRQPQGTLS
jgi:hypothetical protein